MHQLLTQFAVRWLSLMTGAAHATTALRAMTRHAPESDPDDEVPRELPTVPLPTVAVPSVPLATWPKPA